MIQNLPSPKQRLYLSSVPAMTVTTALDLDITHDCNNTCPYCFKRLDDTRDMSLETAQDAVDWLILASKNTRDISVNFMGGEPSLRFGLMRDLLSWGNRRARSAGKQITWSFTSNMSMWNDEIRRWVDERGLGVLMSVDGTPEVQDSQRPSKDGRSKAHIVAKWAKSMLRTRPRSDARFTISPQWVHKLYDSCLYLWEDIGFQSIILADADYENWTDERLATYREQTEKICGYIVRRFEEGVWKSVKIYTYFMKFLVLPKARGQKAEVRLFPCGAGYNYSMIDGKGDIWPCHRFDGAAKCSGAATQLKLGNIYSEPYNEQLSNAFRNNNHMAVRDKRCDGCPVEPRCGGFCPAANLESKPPSLYLPHESYCKLKMHVYEVSENLYASLKAIDAERIDDILDKEGGANPEG
jgi:uncharacterized protein